MIEQRPNIYLPMNASLDAIYQRLEGNMPTREQFERFRPPEGLILHPEELWHGERHAARVLVNSIYIAKLDLAEKKQAGYIDPKIPDKELIDFEGLGWGAMGHDAARDDDCPEWLHGIRSAQRIQQTLGDRMPARSLHTASYLAEWHVTHDEDMPYPISAELAYLEDGDALDRERAANEPWRINYNMLRHDSAIIYFPAIAQALVQVSEELFAQGYGSGFDCVMEGALRLRALPQAA